MKICITCKIERETLDSIATIVRDFCEDCLLKHEVWKGVPGYEKSYEVSDHGRVRCVERMVCTNSGARRMWPQKIMKQYHHFKGYSQIYLRRPGQRKRKFFVHRLVAITFISNPENLPIVNHRDLNKKHNHIANLEWFNEQQNTQHYYDSLKPQNDEPF